jgi:hypothetical protein
MTHFAFAELLQLNPKLDIWVLPMTPGKPGDRKPFPICRPNTTKPWRGSRPTVDGLLMHRMKQSDMKSMFNRFQLRVTSQ